MKYMNNLDEIIKKSEKELEEEYKKIDKICEFNSNKVLNAFKKNKVSETNFSQTTGYGYGDTGRDTLENVYSDIFKSEDSLVRSQIISGSHALTVTLFGLLRPGDTMLSITGKPYDTLDEVIGIKENESSLKSFGINYKQIDLIDNEFDYEKIKETLQNNNIKLIEIQRSKGYSTRKSITISSLEKIIKYIKNIWTIMPMHTKKEKFYVSELKKHLNEYLDDHPQCSYDDIVQQFGEPKDIVVEYIQSSDENDLIKRMKLKTILQKFLIFFSVICTILAIWFGVLWYSYMQDAKNSIIYEIETTISDN